MNLTKLANSLLVAGVNVGLALVAFALFMFPRFTMIGGLLSIFILLLLILDVALVLRDLWRSGTRGRAVVAALLWLPILFLFAMMQQWEGPLYIAVTDYPPRFEIRGLAMFCGLRIYGPEQDKAEWYGDDIGLIWSINHAAGHYPFDAVFTYGELPLGFVQETPTGKGSAPQLDPNVNYRLVVDRCMGGPQTFSLNSHTISEYKPDPAICWGQLNVPERRNVVLVRVDCKTRQPLPMSSRAEERLKAYRENRIPFY